MDEECVFCKIVRGEIDAQKVHESDNFLVFLDSNPRTQGHSLVVPKKHYKDFLELPSELYGEFCSVLQKASKKIVKEINSKGFNILINTGKEAWQVVFHMHAHIIPRSEGDGLLLGR